MPVSTDDYVSVSDFLGRYAWRVDSGDAEGWAALWTEDAIFAGISPEPIVGREALKAVPTGAFEALNGTARHHVGSLWCEYEDGNRDVVIARYYNLVSSWVKGGVFAGHANSTVRLVRHADSWLIARNDTTMMY